MKLIYENFRYIQFTSKRCNVRLDETSEIEQDGGIQKRFVDAVDVDSQLELHNAMHFDALRLRLFRRG